MKKPKFLRAVGLLAASAAALLQLGAIPAQAAGEVTIQDIAACTYHKAMTDLVVKQGDDPAKEINVSDIGVPLGETVTEVWLHVEVEPEKNTVFMPAIGYSAPGYNEYDWYGDGCWMQDPAKETTVIIPIPEDWPLPQTFQLQLWGEDNAEKGLTAIKTMNVLDIGLMTEGGSIGIKTREGDLNSDRLVNLDDVKLLRDYLTTEKEELAVPANGDLDGDNVITAIDLTLLKRGILEGKYSSGDGPAADETAMEFVKHIKLGWNLGNTFDAQIKGAYQSPQQAETAWGNPQTSKAMIDAIKAAGFNTVRVPVSWGEKMNSNYEIDTAWMNRVQEVVDYVIDNDMYCILNIHHDNGYESNGQFVEPSCPYFYPTSAHYEHSEKFVTAVWTQVSERFKNYDNHLIFETLNEPRMIGHRNQWWIDPNNNDCKDAMDCVNKLNAAGLAAIRKSGGQNEKRFVMLPSYAASPDKANLNGVVLPNDDHIIASAHAYNPQPFALQTQGTNKWSADNGQDTGAIMDAFSNLKSRYLDKGIPVIMGEFGAMNKNNEDDRAAWAKYYVSNANKLGIACVWWDNNFFEAPTRPDSGESFGLLRRSSCQIEYPKVMQAMVEATADRG